jgi:outer membrane protein assembly factor BamE (lipoprotein component of BamABCDE complex)
MVNRIMVLLVGLVLFFGCAGSSKNMNKLRLGMSKTEVIEAMGQPNSTSASRDIEFLKYRFTSEYYVKLQSGNVDAFGRSGDFGLGY